MIHLHMKFLKTRPTANFALVFSQIECKTYISRRCHAVLYSTKNVVTKVVCYHTLFHDPVLNGANVTSNSSWCNRHRVPR